LSFTAILYASVASTGDEAFATLDQAVKALLSTQGSSIEVVWKMQYQQDCDSLATPQNTDYLDVLRFPDTPLDLAFDDSILDNVKEAWTRITGDDDTGFMRFEDREAPAEDDEDED